MGSNPTSAEHGATDSTRPTSELVELLEALWEHGNDVVSSAPVSASQLRVLYSLDRDEGMNLRALGELLGSSPPSVSRLCDRLEAQGFLRRLPSHASRRELELHLTSHGRTYLRNLRVRRQEALLALIATMTPAARTALLRGLTGFQDALDEAGVARRWSPSAKNTRSA